MQDWRAHRLASQVRANLELLDAVLADLRSAAELELVRPADEDEMYRAFAKLLERWPAEQRPEDVKRFCDTARLFAMAAGVTKDELIGTVGRDSNRDVIGIPGITPAQGVFVCLFREVGDVIVVALRQDRRRVFSSPEMREVCPSLDGIDPAACVGLS